MIIRSVEVSPYPSIFLPGMIVPLVLSSYIHLKRSRSLQNTLVLRQTSKSLHQTIDHTTIITLFQTLHGMKNITQTSQSRNHA